MPGLLGKKVGMTQVLDALGNTVAVTLIKVAPNTVVQIKTEAKDGYKAVSLGYTEKDAEKKGYTLIREFKEANPENFQLNQTVTVEVFKEGDIVCIQGFSKGRGFAGVIKRHKFKSGPKAHGSTHDREPGSIGARTWPGKVFKGKRFPGRMGFEKITIKKVPVMKVLGEENLLAVKGPVPGSINSLIKIWNA